MKSDSLQIRQIPESRPSEHSEEQFRSRREPAVDRAGLEQAQPARRLVAMHIHLYPALAPETDRKVRSYNLVARKELCDKCAPVIK